MNEQSDEVPRWKGKTGRIEYLVEVIVFLILIVPSMFLSFLALRQAKLSFVLVASSAVVRDLGLMCLVLFFAWRNGEPFYLFGWTRKNFWHDVLIGCILFIPFSFGLGYLEGALRSIGLSAPRAVPSFLSPANTAQAVLAFVLVVVAAFAEEAIFRGYLIRRFDSITGSVTAAVVISTFIFSLGHGYEGTAGLITVAASGVALAVIYLWRKSLTAPIVLHFLQDFVSIIFARYFLK